MESKGIAKRGLIRAFGEIKKNLGYFGVSPFNYYIVQFKVILYLTNYYASQLKVCSGISYAATAAIAHQKKRSKLAALLLDYESQSSEQVLFLDILIFV